MNQIKRKLLIVFFLTLVIILSGCESEEDKLLREADEAFGRSIENLNKFTIDMFTHFVDEECSNQCNLWGKNHLSEDEEVNFCYRLCVQHCGKSVMSSTCVSSFIGGMGVDQEREAKLNTLKEDCNKRGLAFPCSPIKEASETYWSPPTEKANYFRNMCIFRCSDEIQEQFRLKGGMEKEKFDEAFRKESERIVNIVFKSNETCQCTEKDEQGKEIVKEVLLFPSR